ncbi:MAG: class IV adenylate cyclase [candidate division KSB1 bacterium]|jgi:predicted adenylyl cyclase CyaB|nr:class IV adenylate cyclase [candidate division KSB1 bacterium]
MLSNIEIKARVNDADRFHRIASEISDDEQILYPEDTFFNCPRGRLKLRRFPDGTGELIYYERPDQSGPKISRYRITRTQDPQGLLLTLSSALGTIGVVRKKRHLFLSGQTRIHLDDVDGLGIFAELEVVLHPEQSEEEAISIANQLMRTLHIDDADLIEEAYIDLIRRQGNTKDSTG